MRRLTPVLCRLGVFEAGFVEVEPGAVFYLDPSDLVAQTILTQGAWQPEVFQALSGALPQGGVFLDVGAHIGYFSVKSALRVGKAGRVVAFEPNPDTVRKLRASIAVSNLDNVVVEPIACTDRDQTFTLYASSPLHTARSSLARENAEVSFAGAPGEFRVRGRPVDDVVRELGLTRVDAMKVDVEGAELAVLKGSQETLKRFHPKLVVEVRAPKLKPFGVTPEDVFGFLKQIGYSHTAKVDEYDWAVTWAAP